VAAVLAVVVIFGVVLLLPRYLLTWDLAGGPVPSDQASAVNDIRTTLLQGLGGAALLVGAYLTWRQVQVSREGQITERFTRAVGQLGESTIDVRLGGIYALERIAIDSKADRRTIHEVLCAYVRQHAPVHPPDNPASPGDRLGDVSALAAKRELAWEADQHPPLRVQAVDVQAAVTVLGRRLRVPNHEQLELSRVKLLHADLREANLIHADLHYSDLSGSNLVGADLHLADLTGIRLLAAVLHGANLHQADLRTATLWHAQLEDADLRAADLAGADLSGAARSGPCSGSRRSPRSGGRAGRRGTPRGRRGWRRAGARHGAAGTPRPDGGSPGSCPPSARTGWWRAGSVRRSGGAGPAAAGSCPERSEVS
jgi:hypothetical protein